MSLRPLRFAPASRPLLVLTVAALSSVAGCGADFSLFSSGGTGGGSATGVGPAGAGGGSASGSSSTGSSSTGGDVTSSSGSSSTGSSSTGSSSTGSSSSTSSGSTSSEDCLNGVDDDANGLVDCADPACAPGYGCVDPTPPSWTGHFRVKSGAFPEQAPPPCPPGLASSTFYADPAGAAQCSPCACGDIQGAGCPSDPVTCYPGSTTCGGQGQDWTSALSTGTCVKPTNLLGFNIALSCASPPPAAADPPGSCAASTSDFSNKKKWGTQIDVCGGDAAGGGCSGKKVCVPKGSGDPGESLCVRHDGAHSCPMGWSTVVSVYKGADDTRSCGACSCTPQATCSATYTFYDPNMCSTPPNQGYDPEIVIDLGGGCTDVSKLLDQTSWAADGTPPQPSGGCAPSGGDPIGGVAPTGAVTFCCQ